MMRILYYDWDEFNGEDCRDAMRRLGHQVDVFKLDMHGFDLTQEMDEKIRGLCEKKGDDAKRYYDLLFSFDFFS
jgi:spore maturation protein CgeB